MGRENPRFDRRGAPGEAGRHRGRWQSRQAINRSDRVQTGLISSGDRGNVRVFEEERLPVARPTRRARARRRTLRRAKPGRPPKLTDEQFAKLETVLHKSPEDAGYEGIPVWTPKFVQHWLNTQFDVNYTLRHVRRLMDDAGLSWRTARLEHYKADTEEVAEFQETYKKRHGLIDAGKTILTVDHITNRSKCLVLPAVERDLSR